MLSSEEIRKELIAFRKECERPASYIAKRIGVSPQMVNYFEHEERGFKPENLEKLYRLLVKEGWIKNEE